MKVLKTIFLNISIFIILIVILELIFGSWIFNKNGMDNLGIPRSRSKLYDISDLYQNKTNTIKYSRDDFGLRGSLPNQPDKIYILTVGGSTTDQRLINDGETWQDVIENKFSQMGENIIVSNAGIEGQSTIGHIKNFDLWFPLIPDLRPKIILFYVGINEFYIDSNPADDELNLNLFSKIKNYSALYNLLRKFKGSILARKYEAGHLRINFSNVSYTTTPKNNPKEYQRIMKKRDEEYCKRVRTLIERSRQLGAQPIFVTQPCRNYRFNRENIIEGVTGSINYDTAIRGNGVDYYHMKRIQDSAMFTVANMYGVKYFDLANENIWEDDDFYDYFHMTPKGAEKVGSYLFNKLNEFIEIKN